MFKTKSILLGAILLLISAVSVHAGFGISPTDIQNKYLKPGIRYEQEFTLSRRDTSKDLNIRINTDIDEIESWFTFFPSSSFVFPRGQDTVTFRAVIDVPQTAPYATYKGALRVVATGTEGQVAGVSIVQGVRVDVDVDVTQEEHKEVVIQSIKITESAEPGVMNVEVVAENKGNVDLSPKVRIAVMNLLMEELEEHVIDNIGVALAQQVSVLSGQFSTEVEEGEYFFNVLVLSEEEEVLREERIVANIIRITIQEEEEEADESTLLSFIREGDLEYVYLGLGGLLLFIIFVIVFKRMIEKRGTAPKSSSLCKTFYASKNLYAIVMSLILVALLIALYFIITAFFFSPDVVETDPNKEFAFGVNVELLEESEEIDGEFEVLGEGRVVDYSIYAQPSFDSEVILEAEIGQDFDVVEERDGWFRILLEDGEFGWIHMSAITNSATQ